MTEDRRNAIAYLSTVIDSLKRRSDRHELMFINTEICMLEYVLAYLKKRSKPRKKESNDGKAETHNRP